MNLAQGSFNSLMEPVALGCSASQRRNLHDRRYGTRGSL